MEQEGISNEDESTPLRSNDNRSNKRDNIDEESNANNVSRLLGVIESATTSENGGRPPRQMWGIVLVLLSVCAYTCYTLIAKNLLTYRGVPYIQIVFTRSMITWIIDIIWIQWYRRQGEQFSYFGERFQRKWLIIRSLLFWSKFFVDLVFNVADTRRF